MLGHLDRFMNGGVVGDAVQPENLEEAESQQILKPCFLCAALRFAGDKPVERGLPADDTKNELLAKTAIGVGKLRSIKSVFEQCLCVFSGIAALRQNPSRNLSWFLVRQCV